MSITAIAPTASPLVLDLTREIEELVVIIGQYESYLATATRDRILTQRRLENTAKRLANLRRQLATEQTAS